ncbi:SIS domain-containing protein [Allosalinactinospora lopnorensis]
MNTHLRYLQDALNDVDTARIEEWGEHLSGVLARGGRLLACGNGGSAAEAQHLTGELVGRFEKERRPFSAIALHADTSSMTAICNDYGAADVYARQVRAHGRAGDVLVCLSTSGASQNVVNAAATGRATGMTTWALTGRSPNALADTCDDAVAVPIGQVSTVQEVHLALIHVLCEAVDASLCTPQSAARARPAMGTVPSRARSAAGPPLGQAHGDAAYSARGPSDPHRDAME